MAESQARFEGQLAEEYELITLAYPDFESFQRGMIKALAVHLHPGSRLLEIGTGNGFTTRLLAELPSARLVTIDNDPEMVRQARQNAASRVFGDRADLIEIVEADALEYLRSCPTASFDAVASAFTLHNLEVGYREQLEAEVFRVLSDGGVFTNADKYAPEGQERFDALVFQIERFFDAFVEMGKLDLLRKWVTHNVMDQSPLHAMLASPAPERLRTLGFSEIEIGQRSHMQAVLVARKG